MLEVWLSMTSGPWLARGPLLYFFHEGLLSPVVSHTRGYITEPGHKQQHQSARSVSHVGSSTGAL